VSHLERRLATSCWSSSGIVLSLALTACASHSAAPADDTTLAEDGSDSNAAENDAQTLSISLVTAGGATLSLASAGDLAGDALKLDAFGDAVKAAYVPAGCLTATNAPSSVGSGTATYVFDGCFGPFGLRNVTGTVTVDYTMPSTGELVLDFSAANLHVNRATVDIHAKAEIAAKLLGAREMTWSAQLTGTTARGREFQRTNAATVTWTIGHECLGVGGHSDGNVGGRNVHTDVLNFSRCKGECPAAGGEIKITNTDSGRSIDVRYDGGNRATFTGPNGAQAQITLACGL
jgi:hypothetical protein